MNRDDIIRMAREAGLLVETSDGWDVCMPDNIEQFAALVAAAEREKVARWQIGSGYTTGHGETIEDLLVELEWQVRESEREACAKVCETEIKPCSDVRGLAINSALRWAAEAIRARGQG